MFISSPVIITLMATDFPLPVEPAISRCGILDKSATTKLPETSRPSGTANGLVGCAGWASTISRNDTVEICLFGTSIPINDLPGMGASIRRSFAASANAKSSAKLTTLLTLTPTAGCNSYFVTDGPKLTFFTSTWTPKLANVVVSFCELLSIVAYSALWSVFGIFVNSVDSGNW